MNTLSPISVYDNINLSDQTFSKLNESSVYETVNGLLSINGDLELILYCPLCVSTFEYKFSLFEHLINFHRNFLLNMRDRTLNFKECPFCSAKCYGNHLTAKHALVHHPVIVQELFIDGASKCFFCGVELNKKECGNTISHFGEMHFMDFEKAFQDKFSTTISEMTFSEYLNSTGASEKELFNSLNTSCQNKTQTLGSKKFQNLTSNNDQELIKMNSFDFTDLKKQLQAIKSSKDNLNAITRKKSILKNLINNPKPKSVRRVLRFDIPDENNKENKFVHKSANDELQLFDSDKFFIQDFLNTTIENWCVLPKNCSTPSGGKSIGKILVKDDMKKLKRKTLSSVKIVCQSGARNVSEFKYRCGKCQKLFKENLELVCHVKNYHRKIDFRVLKPSYRCGMCNAQFFQNYYLKKHLQSHQLYNCL